MHAVHVGTGAAQVADIALEVLHLYHLLDFAQDGLLAARGNELALVGTDGAKGAAAKAAAVHAHRVTDHLIGRNAFALVAGVGQTRVGQVKRGINLLGGHRRVGAVDLDGNVSRGLPHIVAVPQVALDFNYLEILGLSLHRLLAFLVAVQHHVGLAVGSGQFTQGPSHHRLGNIRQILDAFAGSQCIGNGDVGQFSHAINEHVGRAIDEDRRPESVLPVVVMGQTPQRHLNATSHHWHVGKEPFQYFAIDDGGVVRAGTGTAVGRVSVVAALAAGGCVVVDHRVHGTGRHTEVKPWLAQLLEVAQVVAPVGLRNDGHLVAMGLQHTTDDSATHRRVVDVGITSEQNHVGLFPAQVFHLLACGGQPLPLDAVVGMSVVLTHINLFYP